MAEQVLRGMDASAPTAVNRRHGRSVEDETTGTSVALDEDLAAATTGGQPLPSSTREFFESRFGRSFGDVRVHTSERATRAARAIDAEAFTLGTDVVFRRGAYDPESPGGRRLLAHELTHVVQQRGATEAVQRQGSSPEEKASQAQDWLELSQYHKEQAKTAAKKIADKVAAKSLGGYYTAGKIAKKLAEAAIEGIGKGIDKAQERGVEKVKKAWEAADKLADHGPGTTDQELLETIRRNASPTLNALSDFNRVLLEMTVSVARETVDIVVGHSVDYIAGKLGEMTTIIFQEVLENWGITGWSAEQFVKEASEEQVKNLKDNMNQYIEGILQSAFEDKGI